MWGFVGQKSRNVCGEIHIASIIVRERERERERERARRWSGGGGERGYQVYTDHKDTEDNLTDGDLHLKVTSKCI